MRLPGSKHLPASQRLQKFCRNNYRVQASFNQHNTKINLIDYAGVFQAAFFNF